MTFRGIGEVGSQLMQRISSGDFPLWNEDEPGTERSTVKCAHPSGPHSTVREGDVLRSEWKRTATEAAASADKGGDYPGGRKASPKYLRVVSDNHRCMPRKPRTDAPRDLGIHLRLIEGSAHQNAPRARRMP